MKSFIYTVACLFSLVVLGSCGQDKGSESMPSGNVDQSYEPQLNYLNQLIEDNHDDDELLSKRARVLFNMFRFSEALRDINAAVALKSNNGEYYLLLSQVNFAMKNYFESIKASEKAEGLGVDNPELAVLQARVYWETGDTSRSKLYQQKAEQITPYHSDLSLLKGKQAAFNKDTAHAVVYFLLSIKTDNRNIGAYRNLIKVYLNRGNDDSALYYTLKAREVNPRNPDFYYSEGRIFQKKDLKQSAILAYKNCLREDSLFAPAILQLGQIYFREGNASEAFRFLSRYAKLDNDNKEVYLNIISSLNTLNREHATIPYYERLVQLDSTNIGLKYALQKLYKIYSVEIKPDTTTRVVQPAIVPRDTTVRRVPVRRDTVSRPRPVTPVDTARK